MTAPTVTQVNGQHLTGHSLPSECRVVLIRNTGVTDTGLNILKDLVNLRTIDVRGAKVSPAGIAALRKAIANLNVVER
jgi:hypothetical protein